MIKIFNKPRIEENFISLIKGMYKISTNNIVCTGKRLAFPKIRNMATMHTKINPIQYCTRSPSKCNKGRKINIRHKDWK